MGRLKKYLILLVIIACSAFTFAELPQAPNILIIDNPDKEVTTVEAPKNREHAEMNIIVNKLIPKEIEGIELPTGELLLYFPEEKEVDNRMRKENIFYVTDSIDNFPDISTVNGKKTIANLQKMTENVTSNNINISEFEGFILVEDAKKHPNLYVGVVDKLSGDVSKIWEVKKNSNINVKSYYGKSEDGKFVVEITGDDELKFLVRKGEIKFYSIEDKYNSIDKNRDRNTPFEFTYTFDKYYEAMGFKRDLIEFKEKGRFIGYSKDSKNIYLMEELKRRNRRAITEKPEQTQFSPIKEAKVIKKNGKYYVIVGSLVRVNRNKGGNFPEDDDWIGNGGNYNFSLDKISENYNVSFNFYLDDTMVKTTNNNKLYYDNDLIIYGEGSSAGRNAILKSRVIGFIYGDPNDTYIQDIDLSKYGLSWPPEISSATAPTDPGSSYGWVFVGQIAFNINEEVFSDIVQGKINRIENNSDVIVEIRHWKNDASKDTYARHILLKAKEANVRIIPEIYETIDLSDINIDGRSKMTSEVITHYLVTPGEYQFRINNQDYDWNRMTTSGIALGDNVNIKLDPSTKQFIITRNGTGAGKLSKLISFVKTEGGSKKIFYEHNLTINNPTNGPTTYTTTIDLTNPLVMREDGTGAWYGILRLYPTSFGDLTPKAGYLIGETIFANYSGAKGQQVAGNLSGVSGQFKGFEYDKHKSKHITLKANGVDIGKYSLSSSTDPLGEKKIITNGVDLYFDITDETKAKNGIDLGITSWDYASKKIELEILHENHTNKVIINIPALDGEVYYDKNLGTVDSKGILDYASKKVSNTLTEFLGGELAKFQIGTRDFDLRILGNQDSYSNLRMEIPKIIPVIFVSNGIIIEDQLSIKVVRKNLNTKVEEVDNKYIVSLEKGIDGVTDDLRPEEDSTMLAEATISWDSLKRSRAVDKQDITIEGTNLGLVKIGVPNKMNWTIFDNVEFKIFNKNYNLKFDISEITTPKNNITPSPNEVVEFNITNKIEIYNSKNSLVYSGTGTELENTGWKNDEFGATLKYSNTNQGFIVNKFKNIDYNENFKMLVKAENGVVLRTVNLTLINSDGFEIIDGHGKLDFGDFFPGDIKQAGDTIRFRNIHNAKINVEMESSTTEMSKLDVSNPAENQKIQVRKLEAYELNTQNKNENHFKIKGEAVTTPTTEVGKYKGTAEVIITIIP